MEGEPWRSQGRVDADIEVPIRFGNVAWWRGPKAEETASHRWIAFVRGKDNRDISHVVKKVVFQLHESFANTRREVNQPPFEVDETGWGEFEVGIWIHFHNDCGDGPLDLAHLVALYHHNDQQAPKTKPVVSVNNEEIVFRCPRLVLRPLRNHADKMAPLTEAFHSRQIRVLPACHECRPTEPSPH